MRVRGDGRKYIFNVESPGMARTDDLWQWFMFTRGGPEWEDIVVSSCAPINMGYCHEVFLYSSHSRISL